MYSFTVKEDKDSLALHQDRSQLRKNTDKQQQRRNLNHEHKHKHKHKHDHENMLDEHILDEHILDENIFGLGLTEEQRLHNEENAEKKRHHDEKKRIKREQKLFADPGIQTGTSHGMMIDAGSTGSRMHVYEFKKRVLVNSAEVDQAVSGKKLSYPVGSSRWTERLRPGIDSFASFINDNGDDEQLTETVREYLKPMIEFAKSVLLEKQSSWHEFPIYFKATAGMRILPSTDRSRVMNVVRNQFQNTSFSPFKFEIEYARVISGEEEAIYGWAGANLPMGTLLDASEGTGTVINPSLTYGALDMGGGSTQISFFEPNGDIMSNLFTLQIGPGKHWNLYAHSFLYFGVVRAYERFCVRLASTVVNAAYDDNDDYVQENFTEAALSDNVEANATAPPSRKAVFNPCLPGSSIMSFSSRIHIDRNGIEYLSHGNSNSTTTTRNNNDGLYTAILMNNQLKGDFDACAKLALPLLRKDTNSWCDFAHDRDCSFAGVYQPPLPIQSSQFGEFLATSSYYHVWDFLNLTSRSTLNQLRDRAREVCAMSHEEVIQYNDENDKGVDEFEIKEYCFRAAYTFNLLHQGYGFPLDYYITATKVINGQKVGWPLGSMIYEINTLPWHYRNDGDNDMMIDVWTSHFNMKFVGVIVATLSLMLVLVISIFQCARRRSAGFINNKDGYVTIDNNALKKKEEQSLSGHSSNEGIPQNYGASNRNCYGENGSFNEKETGILMVTEEDNNNYKHVSFGVPSV